MACGDTDNGYFINIPYAKLGRAASEHNPDLYTTTICDIEHDFNLKLFRPGSNLIYYPIIIKLPLCVTKLYELYIPIYVEKISLEL